MNNTKCQMIARPACDACKGNIGIEKSVRDIAGPCGLACCVYDCAMCLHNNSGHCPKGFEVRKDV